MVICLYESIMQKYKNSTVETIHATISPPHKWPSPEDCCIAHHFLSLPMPRPLPSEAKHAHLPLGVGLAMWLGQGKGNRRDWSRALKCVAWLGLPSCVSGTTMRKYPPVKYPDRVKNMEYMCSGPEPRWQFTATFSCAQPRSAKPRQE